MKYSILEKFVSEPRLNRFYQACNNSKAKAQKLYQINLQVAQGSYPLLSLFETFLRNALNEQIGLHFSDPDWIINQKQRFMSDATLSPSRFQLKNSVLKAEATIVRKGSAVTSGKVVAEQTFGFWTSLFENHHFRLVGGAPLQCFVHKPTNINRSALAGKLNTIRQFRNRVYHNEPICFQGLNINFSEVQQTISDIYEIIEWIEPQLKVYLKSFDTLDRKINAGINLI